MIDWAVSHVPVIKRAPGFELVFYALVFVVGLATGILYFHTRYVTQVRVTHPSVAQVLGKPMQTIAGGQVNPALAGLVCGVWGSGQTVTQLYCHR